MGSKTQIFKDACLILGVTPDIQDADTDDSSVCIALRGAWESGLEYVLREHAWQCLEAETILTPVGVARQGWGYQYLYPPNCAKAVEISRPIRKSKALPFKVALYEDEDNGQVKVILTDQPQASLIHTKYTLALELYDVHLCDAIAAYLGFKVSSTLTTAKDAADRAWNAYTRAVNKGAKSDQNEQEADEPVDADYIRGRD